MGSLFKVVLFVSIAMSLVGVAARFHDGPLGPLAGGPLEAGPLVQAKQLDFSFVENVSTIELQLIHPPQSRTTWVVYYDRALYVVSNYMNLALWKQWPHQALIDGRAIARIQGKRYEFQLQRVEDERLWSLLWTLTSRKYELSSNPGDEGTNESWIFRLSPRS